MIDNLFTDINIDNNLIHFFYVIGLDHTLTLNDTFYHNIKSINSFDNLKPTILSKFPPISNTLLNLIDDILLRHCFPNGYVIPMTDSPPSSEAFFLEFNNYPLHEKYTKIYYTCLLFYEPLEHYNQIRFNKRVNEKASQMMMAELKLNSNESIDLSDLSLSKKSISSDLLSHDNYSNYYLPKIIAFASVLPYPRELSKILHSMHKYYSESKNEKAIPIEKLIENFVLGIPLPSKGKFIIQHHLFNNEKYSFDQFPINKIPNNSIELQNLFHIFKVSDILRIYKCLLLEIPLLFFSNHKTRLSTLLEGIISLLYPFKYQKPKISILPTNHYCLIEMSQCFALGINQEYKPEFFTENNLEIENKTIIIVDIDKIQIIEKKANFKSHPNFFLDDVCSIDQVQYVQNLFSTTDIPLHYKKKFMGRLVTYMNKIKDQVHKETFNAVIREEFFYFLLSIFTDISKYIRLDDLQMLDKGLNEKKNDIDINTIFKVKEFLQSVGGENMPFFKRFCETEIFKNYIIRKIYPRTDEERLEVMFFDEKIIEKRNKNLFSKTAKTPLLELKEMAICKKIEVQHPKNFSPEEIELLSRKDKQGQALNYYQMITLVNDKIVIKYPVFPILLYDNTFMDKPYYEIYLRNNIPVPLNLRKDLHKTYEYLVNKEEYNKIYQGTKYNLNLFNQSKALSVSMEDYINLTWLMLFALSYWYIDKTERQQRFAEMLEVFDKLDYYDVSIDNI